MTFDFSEFLTHTRQEIINQWVARIQVDCGVAYSKRPVEELNVTIQLAFDANYQVLIHDDYGLINKFIDKITQMRLEAGFLLSDVQKAFELYRKIVIPLLTKVTTLENFFECSEKINNCLAYTVHRFSEYFQDMHQRWILNQNLRLEDVVRKRTAELQESERKYKTLVEEINDGYFVIQNRLITFANQAFCQMHEYHLKEVIGKKLDQFIDLENRAEVKKIYDKNMNRDEGTRALEYSRLTKSGGRFPTEIHGKIIRYEDNLLGIGVCRDITERVMMEKRVRENERMAYIGQIAASLSHEIRNPLSAIKLNLQILNKNQVLEGNDQRRITISVDEVIKLERILNQLLNFAKPVQLSMKTIRINEIISSYTDLLEIKFNEKKLSVETILEPNIPDIRADGEKLGQAIINLLLNAIESSRQYHRVTIKSKCFSTEKNPFVEVSIEDEAQGFPQEKKEEMFKPYFTTKSKGTGLGLAIVKRIMDAHKGRVEAINNHPKGSVFRLCIPMR